MRVSSSGSKNVRSIDFNGSKKYLSVFTADKKEEKIPVVTVDDIFEHKDKIIASAKAYLVQA